MAERSPFKHLDQVFVADQRNTHISIVNQKTGEHRPCELEDLHKRIAKVVLNDEVPIEVRDHFNLAKNLCLYGWFVYDFGVEAKLRSFIAVEVALRTKFEHLRGKKPKQSGLRQLLKWAINSGLVTDGGFGHLYFEDERELWESLPEQHRPMLIKDREGIEYSKEKLLDAISGLRNSFAHGTSTLMEPISIVSSLHICADVINQLFKSCDTNRA